MSTLTKRFIVVMLLNLSVCMTYGQDEGNEVDAPDISAATVVDDVNVRVQVEPVAPETILPEADPRWDLMGEFVGDVSIDGKTQRYGLQLRPLGERDFQGQLYRGGLPGEEGFEKEGESVIGLHSNTFVVISGGPAVIIARPGSCLVTDADGNKIGELNRIWRVSPTLGAKPPEDAIVLFDGSNTDNFNNGKVTHDGLLQQGADVLPMVQDFNMHVEFLLPYQPTREGQKRGNSGCYLLSRYEVQVLDSFALKPVFNGCGSLYRTRIPDLNMCYPPLRWQTYDIIFTSPRWNSDGSKRRNMHITVWHNGVKIHDDVAIESKTGAGKPEEPSLLPIRFQNHQEPVRYRNIWMVDRGLAVGGAFPRYRETGIEVSTDPPQPVVVAPEVEQSVDPSP